MNSIARIKSCKAGKNFYQRVPRLLVSDCRIRVKATGASVQSGSSLLVVLSILSVLVVVVVSALAIALSDRGQSAGNLARERADSLSLMALDDVAAKLAGIPLDKHWAAAPGRIRQWDGAAWQQVDLHSGAPTPGGDTTLQVNLNAPLADGRNPILPKNSEYSTAPDMSVRWIYVLADGTRITDPTATRTSPVVGRYAYWADLENARVNLNTAGLGMTTFNMPDLQNWYSTLAAQAAATNGAFTNNGASFLTQYKTNVWSKNPWMTDRVTFDANGVPVFSAVTADTLRQNTMQNLTAHPSSVNLAFLDGVTETQSLNTFRYAGSYFLRADAENSLLSTAKSTPTTTAPTYWDTALANGVDLSVRFFQTPGDWSRIVGTDTYKKNKGYLTTRGRTPEINPLGLPKMALSFRPASANDLSDLTEAQMRNDSRTLFVTSSGDTDVFRYLQDSRMVQVPAWAGDLTSGSRRILRDLTALTFNNSHKQRIQDGLQGIADTLAIQSPGVSSSIASKYQAAGEAPDQITTEIAGLVMGSLDPQLPGGIRTLTFNKQTQDAVIDPLNPPPATARFIDENKKHYSGRRLPMVTDTSKRRAPTAGNSFVSEIAAVASTLSFDSLSGNAQVTALNALANTSATNTSLGVNLNAQVNGLPKPTAVMTQVANGANVAWLFLLGDPTWTTPPGPGAVTATPVGRSSDRFIQIVIRAEEFVPPRWSLSPSFELYNLTSQRTFYVPDVIYESGATSVRANFRSQLITRAGGAANSSLAEGITAGYSLPSTTGYQQMSGVTPGTIGIYIGPFASGSTVSFKLKLRMIFEVACSHVNNLPISSPFAWAAIPGIFDEPADPNLATAGVSDMLEFRFDNFDVNGIIPDIESLQANDPRVTRKGANWVQTSSDTLGAQNSNYTGGTDGNDSDLSRPPGLLQFVRGRLRGRLGPGTGSQDLHSQNVESQSASCILGLPGVGYLSSVPTGVDSGKPWATFKFFDAGEAVPDWLLWNYFYVPFDRSIANQTDGKMNINATLWPWGITRKKPLEALLGNRVADSDTRKTLATAIATTAASGGKAIGPDDLFVYQGQIMTVPGMSAGANEYEKESLARSLADIVTTQCDDYRVFVTAESMKEGPTGKLTTMATKRIEATLSRSVDEGGTGMYPGQIMQGPKRFDVITRSGYQTSGSSATRINAYTNTSGQSFTGLDGRPGTSDDWIIPQKIEISDLRYLE
ncbi:MAG: hypothetical protein K8R57_05820 [Verrucomicrobia bacterium]|nr:hypothetical protein [Verrucomicrobiota bacterium]